MQEKHEVDAADIAQLLPIAAESKETLRNERTWYPPHFVVATRERLARYLKVFPDQAVAWKKIGVVAPSAPATAPPMRGGARSLPPTRTVPPLRVSSAPRGMYPSRSLPIPRSVQPIRSLPPIRGRGAPLARGFAPVRGVAPGRGLPVGRGFTPGRGISQVRGFPAARGFHPGRGLPLARGVPAARGGPAFRSSFAGRGASAVGGSFVVRGSSSMRGFVGQRHTVSCDRLTSIRERSYILGRSRICKGIIASAGQNLGDYSNSRPCTLLRRYNRMHVIVSTSLPSFGALQIAPIISPFVSCGV